jgi:DNA repair exonuclease SbcCD ATPase subunit
MTKNNDNDGRGSDLTELPTGEYPALNAQSVQACNGTAELNGAHHAAAGPADAPSPENEDAVRAAFWLSHLETEVSRLHAKWQTIDAEFKHREARIAELNEQIAAREAVIAALKADLQHETAALQAADEAIRGKDGEIATLADDRRVRDERIAALSTELADAEVAHKATREEVESARAEAARLGDLVRQEQAATVASAARNEQLTAEYQQLQNKLQDLEIYINGRHDSWAEQNTKLADYKDALVGMEKTVKARDAAIARQDDERRQLAGRILDLERQCSELEGRRKERESTYDELQQKLAAHIEQTEQLKAEHAARTRDADNAVKQSVDQQRQIESLERGIKRRDETLDALTKEAEQSKSAVTELTAAKNKLASRVDELEKNATDRSQQLQVLRDDLRMAHDQLRTAQEHLSDRTTQLASSQQAVDQKTRHIERLAADLEGVQREASLARVELEKLEAHASELGRLRGEAAAEADQLKAELAAQHDVIASLEAELKSKQAAANLLERNVGRITDLGASLAALDKQMNGGTRDGVDPLANQSSIHLADFVATLAIGDEAIAAEEDEEEEDEAEMLPMDLLLDDDRPDNVVDIGERLAAESPRKLIITIGGEPFTYPIVKNLMTIGRAHEADIRIASHFVSRVHAKVSTKGIATIIEDAGSKNGILVNSERVKRRVLHHGDVVSLGGEFNLKFVDAVH